MHSRRLNPSLCKRFCIDISVQCALRHCVIRWWGLRNVNEMWDSLWHVCALENMEMHVLLASVQLRCLVLLLLPLITSNHSRHRRPVVCQYAYVPHPVPKLVGCRSDPKALHGIHHSLNRCASTHLTCTHGASIANNSRLGSPDDVHTSLFCFAVWPSLPQYLRFGLPMTWLNVYVAAATGSNRDTFEMHASAHRHDGLAFTVQHSIASYPECARWCLWNWQAVIQPWSAYINFSWRTVRGQIRLPYTLLLWLRVGYIFNIELLFLSCSGNRTYIYSCINSAHFNNIKKPISNNL